MRNSEMRRFALKVLTFGGLMGLLYLGLGLWMYHVEKIWYYGGLNLAPGDTLIGIGDSRSVQNLNPAMISGLKNMSLTGSQVAVWEKRLRDIVEANRIDGVSRSFIVEAIPEMQVEGKPHVRDWERDRAFLWLLDERLRKSVEFDNLLLEFFRTEFPSRFCVWLNTVIRGSKLRSGFCGGFSAPAARGGYTRKEREQEHSKWILGLGDKWSCKNRLQKFEQMLPTIQSVGGRMIVVTFPIYGVDSTNEHFAAFQREVSDWCRQRDIPYLDFSGLRLGDEYWLDAVHLNRRGAEIIWRECAKKLASSEGLRGFE